MIAKTKQSKTKRKTQFGTHARDTTKKNYLSGRKTQFGTHARDTTKKKKQLLIWPQHAWAIMDLISELSFNNEQRINFPITSVDGLKLFRSSATALISFGNLLKSNVDVRVRSHYQTSPHIQNRK